MGSLITSAKGMVQIVKDMGIKSMLVKIGRVVAMSCAVGCGVGMCGGCVCCSGHCCAASTSILDMHSMFEAIHATRQP